MSKQVLVTVDRTLYSDAALFRVAYLFTGDYFVDLQPDGNSIVHVYLAKKNGEATHESVAGDFRNALIDEKVRRDIATETGAIRELLVAQAFAEADLLDRTGLDANISDDPRGIAR